MAHLLHRSRFASLVFAVVVPFAWGSCGGGTPCRPETWTGTCSLQVVTKVRETELPLPSVVLEAIYRPESSPVLLPDVRREFIALMRYEEPLRAHVEAHQRVSCYVSSPPPGQCNPGPIVVEVPEFDATKVTLPPEPDIGPKGCAQIDATSTQDRIQQRQTEAEAVPERFQFQDGSAELPSDAQSVASGIARRLKQDPTIQCMGVVGQFVRGENLELAYARARAVRQLLIQQGVEPERLLTLTLDRPTTSGTGTLDPASPADRRVSLSVLLRLSSGPGSNAPPATDSQ